MRKYTISYLNIHRKNNTIFLEDIMGTKFRSFLNVFLLSIIVAGVLVACSNNDENKENTSSNNDKQAIEMGQINWAENIAVTNMWKVILEEEGYDVNLNLRSEEHTSELQSRGHLVCRLLIEEQYKPLVYHGTK